MTVLAAIRRLPEAYRETLVLRLVEGMTGPEIAERTGLTPGSVRVNLHRGMQMLREALGRSDEAVSGDYLWDGSGEPDPEIQRLETALRPLRGTRPAPEPAPRRPRPGFSAGGWGALAAAAAVLLALAAVVDADTHARGRADRARGLGARLARGRVLAAGARGAGDPARRRRVDRHPREPRAALDRRDRRGAAGAGPRGSGGWTRASARIASRSRAASCTPSIWAPPGQFLVDTPSAMAVDLGCSYTLEVDGGRLRPPARRGGLGGLREPRAAVAGPRRRRLPHEAWSRAGHAVLRDRTRGPAPGPRARSTSAPTGARGAPPSSAGSPRPASATRSRCGTCCRVSTARIAAASSIGSQRSCRRRSRSRARASCAATGPSATCGGTSWGWARRTSGGTGRPGGATRRPAPRSPRGRPVDAPYQLAWTSGRSFSSYTRSHRRHRGRSERRQVGRGGVVAGLLRRPRPRDGAAHRLEHQRPLAARAGSSSPPGARAGGASRRPRGRPRRARRRTSRPCRTPRRCG